jgi:hypothetical protein
MFNYTTKVENMIRYGIDLRNIHGSITVMNISGLSKNSILKSNKKQEEKRRNEIIVIPIFCVAELVEL